MNVFTSFFFLNQNSEFRSRREARRCVCVCDGGEGEGRESTGNVGGVQ